MTAFASIARALMLAACVAGSGCAGALQRRQNAINTFESWYACPADRVTAAEHAISPPADVATDPARVALWWRSRQGFLYFRVEGCGTSTIFACVAEGWCKRYVEAP
jgi:hypothetical protein